jgi:hypothetical protein
MLQSAEEAVKILKIRLATEIRDAERDEINHKFTSDKITLSEYATELLKINDRFNDRMGYEDNHLKQKIAERENRNG